MRRLLLAAILVLAAALRLAGISWGLRQEPHSDERVFVENAAAMVAAGNLDHRYYEYPGLFFYLLGPVLWAAGAVPVPGVRGYLAARALVDLFGVLDVALVFFLVRRMAGPAVGLTAALLLAVSPLDVFTAQTARPDIVVQAFVTLSLIATLLVGTRLRHDAYAGLAIGAAASVKFSGLLAVSGYAGRRLAAAGPRLRGLAVAGLCATGLLAASMSASFCSGHGGAVGAGLADQWGYHFDSGFIGRRFFGILGFFGAALWREMGPLACGLAVVAAVAGLARRRPQVLPLVSLLVVTVAVHCLAGARFVRFLVPVMGAFCALAALGADWAARRLRLPLAAVAVLLCAWPLVRTVGAVRVVLAPHPLDRILDALDRQVPAGAIVFLDAPELGIDRARYRVVSASGDPALDRHGIAASAYAVVRPGSAAVLNNAGAGALAAAADDVLNLPLTELYAVPPSLAARYVAVPGESLADGDQRRTILRFREPHDVARIRLLGVRRIAPDGRTGVAWSPDPSGDDWRALRALAVPGAPALDVTRASDAAFVFAPVPARRVRVRTAPGPKRTAPPIAADELAR